MLVWEDIEISETAPLSYHPLAPLLPHASLPSPPSPAPLSPSLSLPLSLPPSPGACAVGWVSGLALSCAGREVFRREAGQGCPFLAVSTR